VDLIGFVCIFAFGENNCCAPSMNCGMIATGNHVDDEFAARSTTVARNSPPDCCIQMVRIRSAQMPYQIKKAPPFGGAF
jgi:hypothetical protein